LRERETGKNLIIAGITPAPVVTRESSADMPVLLGTIEVGMR